MTQANRRQFACAAGLGLAGVLVARRAHAQTPGSAGPAEPALVDDLVAANRILVDQDVTDRPRPASTSFLIASVLPLSLIHI